MPSGWRGGRDARPRPRSSAPVRPLGPVFDADPEKGPTVGRAWAVGVQRAQVGRAVLAAQRDPPRSLHSELGVPGEASLATQRRFLIAGAIARGRAGNPARRHHGGAWWEHQATRGARCSGRSRTMTLAVLASQWLQAEALRYYIEETRRRWPHSGGHLSLAAKRAVAECGLHLGGGVRRAAQAGLLSPCANAYRPYAAYSALSRPDQSRRATPLTVEVWALNDGARPGSGPDHHPARSGRARFDGPATAAGYGAGRIQHPPAGSALALAGLPVGSALSWSGGMSSRYCFSNAVDAPFATMLDHPALIGCLSTHDRLGIDPV